MTIKKKQPVKTHKKPERPPLELIQQMPQRRSRAEQNRHHMTVRSFPHAIIGNIAQFFGAEAAAKALKAEREMGLLDIITSIDIVRSGDEVTLCFFKHTIDTVQRRIEQQCAEAKPTVAFVVTSTELNAVDEMVTHLLKAYHSVAVGGRTIRQPFTAANWTISNGLTVDPGKGLASIRIDADTHQTMEQASELLSDIVKRETYSVSFTQSAIMVQGDRFRFVSYEAEEVDTREKKPSQVE